MPPKKQARALSIHELVMAELTVANTSLPMCETVVLGYQSGENSLSPVLQCGVSTARQGRSAPASQLCYSGALSHCAPATQPPRVEDIMD